MAEGDAVDATVEVLGKFSTFTSNIWGSDKVFKVMVYASRLAALGLQRLQASDGFGDADPRLQLAAFAGEQALGRVADKVTEGRHMLRFFGLADWVVALARNPHRGSDPVLALLHDAGAVSMILFHPTDHVAWLNKAVPGVMPAPTVSRLQTFGTRCACLFLACQLLLKAQQAATTFGEVAKLRAGIASAEAEVHRQATVPDVSSAVPADGSAKSPREEGEDPGLPPQEALATLRQRLAVCEEELTSEALSILRYFVDWLVTLHYSLPQGLGLSPTLLNSMGLFTAVLGGHQQWRGMFSK